MTTTWIQQPEIGQPCTIIGEVAQAHDGSLGMAHAFIDAIANAGADAVKFQTHLAHAESTPSEPWRTRFSLQDDTRYEYWRRMEFTAAQWQGLKDHADQRGLLFLSSPFSLEAFALLNRVGVAGWKVASGEITNSDILEAMLSTGLPIMLSTGMSPLTEIDTAVQQIQQSRCPLAVLQCTSMYPCPPELVGLNLLEEFRNRYHCAVGLSDHSATIYPGLAAATLGIEVLEVHVTLSREMFGPDVKASLTTQELRQLITGIRTIERMKAHPVDKTTPPEDVSALRPIFMKSLVAAQDIPPGTILDSSHLAAKKPGTGIPATALSSMLGKRTRRFLAPDTLLSWDDVEDPS